MKHRNTYPMFISEEFHPMDYFYDETDAAQKLIQHGVLGVEMGS